MSAAEHPGHKCQPFSDKHMKVWNVIRHVWYLNGLLKRLSFKALSHVASSTLGFATTFGQVLVFDEVLLTV